MKTLADLLIGEKGKVAKIKTESSMHRRFRDIGIVDGTTIKCTGKSIHGDIASYMIKGAVIALRKSDAETVYIE